MSLIEGTQPRGSHAVSKGCREGALLEVLDTSAVLASCGLSLPASGLSFLAGQEAVSAEAQPGERLRAYLPLRCPPPWSAGQQEPKGPHSGGHLTSFQLKSLRFLQSLKVCPIP